MSLTIILGPMYSGKTTELSRMISVFSSFGEKTFIINSVYDVRSPDVLSCRNSLYKNVSSNGKKVLNLSELDIDELIKNFDVIAIDECQFFSDLYNFVNKLLDNKKVVILCGLNGDKNQKKFGQILDLIPRAKDLIFLKAFCYFCKRDNQIFNPAPFTISTIKKDDQIYVSKDESQEYFAVCVEHLQN